jgi:hypothetical protein
MHGVSSIIRARLFGAPGAPRAAPDPSAGQTWPPSPYTVSGAPWPLQPPISLPVNPNPGGQGQGGNGGQAGNKSGNVRTGFQTLTR